MVVGCNGDVVPTVELGFELLTIVQIRERPIRPREGVAEHSCEITDSFLQKKLRSKRSPRSDVEQVADVLGIGDLIFKVEEITEDLVIGFDRDAYVLDPARLIPKNEIVRFAHRHLVVDRDPDIERGKSIVASRGNRHQKLIVEARCKLYGTELINVVPNIKSRPQTCLFG